MTVENIPTPMWGYVYYILSASIILFATWILYGGIKSKIDGNITVAIMFYTASALLIMGGLWHLGVIQ